MPAPLRAVGFALLSLTLCGAWGCAGMAQPGTPEASIDFQPPASWRSAVKFRLGDPVIHHPGVNHTTRVEFAGPGGTRDVSNRNLFVSPGGEVRTPWYRLTPSDDPLVLRITIEYPNSARTIAEYPLFPKRGEFYTVVASVYKRVEDPARPATNLNPVAYPLSPGSIAQPGDSLWVSFFVSRRDCFGCPM